MKVIGIDSETVEGPPCLLQFYSEDLPLSVKKPVERIEFVTGKNSLDNFIDFLNDLPSDGSTYLLFGHNLSFDLISFFYSQKEKFLEDKYDFSYRGWNFTGIYSTGLAYTHAKKGYYDNEYNFTRTANKRVEIIDTFAFYKGSLNKLAGIFCPGLPKLDAPSFLGKRQFKRSDKSALRYAIRDAEIAYHVGKHIEGLFREYDVRPCVSIAQLGARIFRHKFVKRSIPLQPKGIIGASLHSYHGGKNNRTVERGLYKNVYSIDIISAYPYAMSLLPSFPDKSLYRGIESENVRQRVPEFGIYKISGKAKECRWPILFSHGFKAIKGIFNGIWTTGFEINEALRSKEIKIDSLFGYYYDAEADKNESPFKAYVEEFFREKDEAKTPPQRQKAKDLLNSLYGKFIQKDKVNGSYDYIYDEITEQLTNGNREFVAGGLFNPFIASLITGHTRAYIHRLEHKYKALHTATDGIIAELPCKTEKHLGGIKLEFKCDAYIFRTKVYLCYSKTPLKETDLKSILYPGKYIIKHARHGFHAGPEVLERMIKTGIYEYEYTKVNKLKESLKRGLQVNKFESRKACLKLDKG